MFRLKDSRGKDSHTLAFVTIAFSAGTIGFLYSIFNGNPPDLSGYGMFVSGAILPYLVREIVDKTKEKK